MNRLEELREQYKKWGNLERPDLDILEKERLKKELKEIYLPQRMDYFNKFGFRNFGFGDTPNKIQVCFIAWLYITFAGYEQKKICDLFGVTPRYYRDVRDSHEPLVMDGYFGETIDDWDYENSNLWVNMMFKSPMVSEFNDKFHVLSKLNVRAFEKVCTDLQLVNMPDFDKWFGGADVPHIDKYLEKATESNGGYTDFFDRWVNCDVLRYHIIHCRNEGKLV